jgi:hypothetical protein
MPIEAKPGNEPLPSCPSRPDCPRKRWKLLKLGTVRLDETRIKVNALFHGAPSRGHIEPPEIRLKAEAGTLPALAERPIGSAGRHEAAGRDFPAPGD